MTETSEATAVGRPPKKEADKLGKPRQITMKKADWDRVDQYMADHDEQWMEFARGAIFDKLAKGENE